jgi:hypothetical protein
VRPARPARQGGRRFELDIDEAEIEAALKGEDFLEDEESDDRRDDE